MMYREACFWMRSYLGVGVLATTVTMERSPSCPVGALFQRSGRERHIQPVSRSHCGKVQLLRRPFKNPWCRGSCSAWSTTLLIPQRCEGDRLSSSSRNAAIEQSQDQVACHFHGTESKITPQLRCVIVIKEGVRAIVTSDSP